MTSNGVRTMVSLSSFAAVVDGGVVGAGVVGGGGTDCALSDPQAASIAVARSHPRKQAEFPGMVVMVLGRTEGAVNKSPSGYRTDRSKNGSRKQNVFGLLQRGSRMKDAARMFSSSRRKIGAE